MYVGTSDLIECVQPPGAAAMKIGEILTHCGRAYYLRGFDPHGVRPRCVYLEDPLTGGLLVVSAEELDLSVEEAKLLRLVERSEDTRP